MAAVQSPSLYVGDLLPECTEANLWDHFSKVGTVNSLRLCRDSTTRKSRGYAYVNFALPEDADRALNTLNHSEINVNGKSKPCRIAWADRDNTIRKSGVGNVFVKNLPVSFDSKRLNDLFSLYGTIISCTVRMNEKGESTGLGYVQFESEQAASDAIEKLNHSVHEGNEITVMKFVKKAERPDNTLNWRQVYSKHFPSGSDIALSAPNGSAFGAIIVENLPADFKEAELRALFAAHGNVEFAAVDGSRGLVQIADNEKAQDAATAVNKTNVRGNEIVARMKPWSEADLVALFTKYVAESEMSSVYVAHDEAGNSKGYAITTFETNEGAVKAINGIEADHKSYIRSADGSKKIIFKACRSVPKPVRAQQIQKDNAARKTAKNSRTLFVKNFGDATEEQLKAFFQEHKANVQKINFNRRYANTPKAFAFVIIDSSDDCNRVVQSTNEAQLNGKNIYVAAYKTKDALRTDRSHFNNNRPRGPFRNMHPMPNRMYAVPAYNFYNMNQPMPYNRPVRNMNQRMVPGNMRHNRPVGAPYNMGGRPNVVMNPQVRNPRVAEMMPQAAMPQQQPQQMPGGFDFVQFSNSSPEQQKQMIGEELYPRIHGYDAAQAGKITGMLLEMDVTELLHLMQDPAYLEAKVKEAQHVLASV